MVQHGKDKHRDGSHQCSYHKYNAETHAKLDKILQALSSLDSRITDKEVKLAKVSATVTDHDHSLDEMKSSLDMTESHVQAPTAMANNHIYANYKFKGKLENQTDDLSNTSRRNNVIINVAYRM